MSKNKSHSNGLAGRDPESGRFLAGNHASPGRKIGSRVKLSDDFLRDLHKQWEKSGSEALARVATEFPAVFVKVVASILPKQLDETLNVNIGLFQQVEDFNSAYKLALTHIGSELEPEDGPALIEADADVEGD